MEEDWRSWCRLCGKDSQHVKDVIIENDNFVHLTDAVQKLLDINISESDHGPTVMCEDCTDIIGNLIGFYTRCLKVQEMYSEILCNSDKFPLKSDLAAIRKKYEINEIPPSKLLMNLSNENITIPETTSGQYQKYIQNSYPKISLAELTTEYNLKQTKINQKTSNITSTRSYLLKSSKDNFTIEDKLPASTFIYCEICGKVFTNHRGYAIHLKIKHSISQATQPCKYCGKTFKMMALLRKHENSHLPSDEKIWYPCQSCDKKFSSDSGLWSHIHTVHDKNRSVMCEECGKKFPTKSYLKSHKLSHTKVNEFQCPKCPMKLKRQRTLMIHLQTHGENFICPICGTQLNTKKTLRDHMVVHSDDKKFKCNICDKVFKREKTLNSHLILHTGLKPYECQFCNRRFAHGSNFRTHQKNNHPSELAELEANGERRTCKDLPRSEHLKAINRDRN